MKYYASICLIAKDEDKDIMEWLYYHLAIGFEHIVIYDNNSVMPLSKTLQKFIEAGLVTVFDLKLNTAQQLSAYMHALQNFGKNTEWLAFIDTDEFILPMKNNDIRDFLDDYRQYGAVAANWEMFGSNGHISRPAGGILENYTKTLGTNGHIKSIVRPAVVTRALSAHHFSFKDNFYCVNEDFVPVVNFHTYPLASKIRINHYYYKSQQDFYDKINRGLVTQMKSGRDRKIADFYEHLNAPTLEAHEILRFLPLMRRLGNLNPQKIAEIVHTGISANLVTGIQQIHNEITGKELDKAAATYSKLSRYYDNPDLNILGARIMFMQSRPDAGLALLKREMTKKDVNEEDLRACYNALADFYEINGKVNIKKSLLEYLN